MPEQPSLAHGVPRQGVSRNPFGRNGNLVPMHSEVR